MEKCTFIESSQSSENLEENSKPNESYWVDEDPLGEKLFDSPNFGKLLK